MPSSIPFLGLEGRQSRPPPSNFPNHIIFSDDGPVTGGRGKRNWISRVQKGKRKEGKKRGPFINEGKGGGKKRKSSDPPLKRTVVPGKGKVSTRKENPPRNRRKKRKEGRRRWSRCPGRGGQAINRQKTGP